MYQGKAPQFSDTRAARMPAFLNMQHNLPSTLSFHSEKLEKLVEDLEAKFAWRPVHPKEELASIMYRSGQWEVVQYVKSILNEDNVSI